MDKDQKLLEIIRQNDVVWECLHRLPSLELPDWYLGAGCIAQTVWNHAHNRPLNDGIIDYDLVYFDENRSQNAEAVVAQRVCDLLADLRVCVDVKNEARVHLWYPTKFHYTIQPYSSTADAISTWPTTATAVGIRTTENAISVCAPFGTEDLLGLIVRANRVQITPDIYATKVARWSQQWPSLMVLPWEQGVGTIGARRDGPVEFAPEPRTTHPTGSQT